jgi:hypothetical protein
MDILTIRDARKRASGHDRAERLQSLGENRASPPHRGPDPRVPVKNRSLTRAQFEQLVGVSPEKKWLANIANSKTRRGYKKREMREKR